ncbi:MAG TPA: lipid-A-disaccharide synthase, partial [Ignavibacteria bacterium]|nr:lipid-A-disaccharide synthase [Ignavibacteria bacterium]
IKEYTYDLLKHSKLGIIKSGTSTLEAGLFNLPMVIVYKTNYLTYLIGKNIIKLDYIGLVNIVLGKKVVPELIQNSVSSETIYNECKNILSDRQIYFSIKNDLNPLKEKLGSKGASEKAAKIIYDCLK